MEKKIIIAKCVRCGKLLLSRIETETKICPYCNIRFSLDTAVVVASSESSKEAKALLAELKKRQAQKQTRRVKQKRLE